MASRLRLSDHPEVGLANEELTDWLVSGVRGESGLASVLCPQHAEILHTTEASSGTAFPEPRSLH
jgi:hypothetical protein